jgi:F-type H+-transporting ATPase subunit a
MFETIIMSPLAQFEVISLISINAPILGYLNISLTNYGLYALLALLIIVGLHMYGDNDSKIVPNN